MRKNLRDAFILAFITFFGILVGNAISAHAQTGGFVFSPRESPRPHGLYIVAWNATGIEIQDGTLVMADTSGASASPQIVIGKGFKTFDGNLNNIKRILGVTLGNVPGYAQGRIMVRGFHPSVKVGNTPAALGGLRPRLDASDGSLEAWSLPDSVEEAHYRPLVGIFQKYSRPDSSRGYAWLNVNIK